MSGDSDRPGRNRGLALTVDDRAHVPFAVISVFLLVTSVLVVGYLQARDTPSVEQDVDLAMDRTDAAIQTAVRDGATRASERVAQEPLTTVANTTYGSVLDPDRAFEEYLRALVYIETRQRLHTAGQRVGSVGTNVTLPPVDDPDSLRAAIDSVELSPDGSMPGSVNADARDADAGRGEATLTVELTNITTTATRGDTVVETRTDSVTVTIATPLLQLHQRTELFQDHLDAGITEAGLSQRFNARTYAIGWARGYAQYGGMPITEVIANRHVKPAVNDAVYRTQKEVFGAADPDLKDAVRRGWVCMAMQDAQELYDGYSKKSLDRDVASDLCEASNYVFGDQATGELPSPPDTMQLLGNAPGMDESETMAVGKTAALPVGRLATPGDEHSIDAAIDRIFTVETRLDASYDRGELDLSVDCKYGAASQELTNMETNARATDPEPLVADREYVSSAVTVIGIVELSKECYASQDRVATHTRRDVDSFSVGIDLVLEENEASPHATIDEINDVGIDYKYDRGPGTPETGRHVAGHGRDRSISRQGRAAPVPGDASFRNYDGIAPAVASEIFGGTTASDVERWVERAVGNPTNPDAVTLPELRTVTIDHGAHLNISLKAAIVADITAIQAEIARVTYTFPRSDLVHQGRPQDEGPVAGLIERVRAVKVDYLERDEAYVNVGQKAIYEARDAYFEALEADLQRLEDAHGSAMGAVDDELSEVDAGLDDALSFLQQGVTAEDPDPVPIDAGHLLDGLSYEVSGSPTYFVTENVTKADVPQVEAGVSYAPMAVKNENYLRVPYQSIGDGVLGAVANALDIGSPEAEITFRTAGDALRAGNLAAVAAGETDNTYTDRERLTRLTGDVETATERAIEEFEAAVARQITLALYPGDVTVYCPRGAEYDCETAGVDVPADCDGNASCAIDAGSVGANASDPVEAAVGAALDEYGTTAARAIAIGDGNVTAPILSEVSQALANGTYRPAYAANLSDDGWHAVVESAVGPAVREAAGESAVTLDSTETIAALDEVTRGALENVTADILADRIDEFPDGHFEINEDNYGQWVGGKHTPLRVPAGVPLVPVPGYWFATMNVWDVEARGQYARFELTANVGTPDTTTATTYVRENRTVTLEIDGQHRRLGRVEPIDFSTRSILIVVVPPGGVGVGDRDDQDPECSPTWPVVGDVDTGTIHCEGPPSEDGTNCTDGTCRGRAGPRGDDRRGVAATLGPSGQSPERDRSPHESSTQEGIAWISRPR